MLSNLIVDAYKMMKVYLALLKDEGYLVVDKGELDKL
jgi:hypothetical protein